MIELNEIEKNSALARKIKAGLEKKLGKLMALCARPLSPNDVRTDMVQTAMLRGQILALESLLKDFKVGSPDPAFPEDESPQV